MASPQTIGLLVTVALAGAAIAGCADTPDDANIEVFQTVDEVAAARRAQQLRRWKEMAAAVVQSERTGVAASPGEAFSVIVEADGARQEIDLSPLTEPLSAQNARAAELLRGHLRTQLPAFDQKRLAAMSFEQARARLRPMLLNGQRLDQVSAALVGEGASLPARHVILDLHWVPSVRWGEDTSAASPVGPEALRTWNVGLEELERIAMENLRGDVRGPIFETSRIGSTGQVGHLKAGVEPAMILLPEFLAAVRAEWGTDDDLAVLLASEDQVRFTESGNKKLLDLMWPHWKRALEGPRPPLCSKLVLLTEQGLRLLDYTPTVYIPMGSTRPSGPGGRVGPASRPAQRPYITR